MRPIGVEDGVECPPAHDAFASFVCIAPRGQAPPGLACLPNGENKTALLVRQRGKMLEFL